MSDAKIKIPSDFAFNPRGIARAMFAGDVYDWWGEMLNLGEVHKVATGKGVEIAVIDTGFMAVHPDLLSNGTFETFIDDEDVFDKNGHGTHVRGIIGMQESGAGYVGVAPGARVHCGKVLNRFGEGTLASILQSLDWVADNRFDWVNGSLSIDRPHPKITKKIKQLEELGIGCTFAAGNEFAQNVAFPASLEYAIAVGAHDFKKIPADFSNIGKALDLLAPGVHIKSTWIDGNYKSASGSSMAAPVVTGLCALIIELERNIGA